MPVREYYLINYQKFVVENMKYLISNIFSMIDRIICNLLYFYINDDYRNFK